jgi:hypothetical protein
VGGISCTRNPSRTNTVCEGNASAVDGQCQWKDGYTSATLTGGRRGKTFTEMILSSSTPLLLSGLCSTSAWYCRGQSCLPLPWSRSWQEAFAFVNCRGARPIPFHNARFRESDATSDSALVILPHYKCMMAAVSFCPRFMKKPKLSLQVVAPFIQT